MQLREEQRKSYESKTINNPEIDLNNAKFIKLKSKDIEKININLLKPESWALNEIDNQSKLDGKLCFLNRNYADNSSIILTVRFEKENNNFGREYINNLKTLLLNTTILTIGIDIDSSNIVTSLIENGGAELAGILIGDKIISIENKPIITGNEFKDVYKTKKEGEQVELIILRNENKFSTKVKLLKREGFYKGDVQIGGFFGYFFSYIDEYEEYGEKKKILIVNNFIPTTNNNLLLFRYTIFPNNSFSNLEFEFKRFKRLMMNHLSSITFD